MSLVAAIDSYQNIKSPIPREEIVGNNPLLKAIKQREGVKTAVKPVEPPIDNDMERIIKTTASKYGIPTAVAYGMYAAEGRDKGLGAKRNNYYNIAAFDENPDAAYAYPTPQAGVEAAMKFISGKANNYASPEVQKKFQAAYKLYAKDPVKYIKAIEQAGYAGDPTTYGQRATNGYTSYADFIMDTPEFKKYAMK